MQFLFNLSWKRKTKGKAVDHHLNSTTKVFNSTRRSYTMTSLRGSESSSCSWKGFGSTVRTRNRLFKRSRVWMRFQTALENLEPARVFSCKTYFTLFYFLSSIFVIFNNVRLFWLWLFIYLFFLEDFEGKRWKLSVLAQVSKLNVELYNKTSSLQK